MTQRNYRNPRNTGDKKKGVARKSASSAKIKSTAGASVYTRSSSSKDADKPKRRRDMSDEEKHEQQQERRRERALAASAGTLPEYKKWRRRWWIALVVAIVAVAASWGFSALNNNGMLPAGAVGAVGVVSVVGLVVGYAAIIFALYIDLGKIRKIRKEQEAKARTLTKRQKQELDAAIDANDQQYEAELQQGRGFRMPWSKKDAIENDGKGNVISNGKSAEGSVGGPAGARSGKGKKKRN